MGDGVGGGRERESPKFLEVSEGRAEFCLTRLQTQQASKLACYTEAVTFLRRACASYSRAQATGITERGA